MANNPPNPPNSQRPGAPGGSSENPLNKPRATIMLKKNPSGGAAPSSGSSAKIVPVSGTPPGSSARLVPGQSGRSPAASARRPAVPVDREALGLSSARPSEAVAGLSEAAKRAEALAAREDAKRKSGGRMNANIALHVDDTGARWKRYVLSGLVGAVVLGGLVFGTLFWLSNRQRVPDRAAFEETRGILNELGKQAELMKPFDESETITAQGVKERLKGELEGALKDVHEQLKRDAAAKRNPDTRVMERRNFIEKLLAFKDGWGKPLTIGISGRDDVEFASTGKFDGASPEPVTARVRAGSAASK